MRREDVSTLPKWAQERIKAMQAKVDRIEHSKEELKHSRVRVVPVDPALPNTNIWEQDHVQFDLGDGHGVDVFLSNIPDGHGTGAFAVYVRACGGRLLLTPVTGNMMRATVSDFFKPTDAPAASSGPVEGRKLCAGCE